MDHQCATSPIPPLYNLGWLDPHPALLLRRWLYRSPPLPIQTDPQLTLLTTKGIALSASACWIFLWKQFWGIVTLCVLLHFILLILGNRFGPRASSKVGSALWARTHEMDRQRRAGRGRAGPGLCHLTLSPLKEPGLPASSPFSLSNSLVKPDSLLFLFDWTHN